PAWQTGAAWAGESRVAHPGRLYARDMSAVGGPRGAWPTYACPCESAGYPLRGTGGQSVAPRLRSRRNTSAPGTALAAVAAPRASGVAWWGRTGYRQLSQTWCPQRSG